MDESCKPSITVPILGKYFPIVKELRTYLSEILNPLSHGDYDLSQAIHRFEPRENDCPLYCALLNTSYVALTVEDRTQFQVFPAMVNMREVLDKAQERIFRSKNSQNILTAGYRRARITTISEESRLTLFLRLLRMEIEGSKAWVVLGPEWDMLLQRIGVDAMLHLLTETHIFISLPNDCLCQMTGEPIIHTKPAGDSTEQIRNEQSTVSKILSKRRFPFAENDQEQRPAKRQKTKMHAKAKANNPAATANTNPKLRSATEIPLIRARLFYSRPRLVPQTNQIIVGLPAKHILNRLSPSYQKQPKVMPGDYVDPDPKQQEERARHLAKYVFPRQYGLSSPFVDLNSKKHAFILPDYADRELEIKTKGSCKTPKRLKGVLPLLEAMIWRHGKCGYKPLRDKVCPTKLKSTGSKDLDTTIILEIMSEQSSLLRSQADFSAIDMSVDSEGNSIMPFGQTQAERHAKSKPRFAEFACPVIEVYRYIALMTKVVIPKAFWGSETNRKLILTYVEQFIQCRRFETLTLHHIIQRFSTSECDWLTPPGNAARQQSRVSVSDALKRREVLEEFLFWYFDSFVSSLLKTNFYITESSAFRNRVLYFRQDDWKALCSPLIERLTTGTFVKMSESEAKEVLRQRKLGFSFVRLLPKDTGVRPIVNLRRRKTVQKGAYSSEQSINQILQAAFQILSYEKRKQPDRLGASVFSPDDIYQKLTKFKSRLPRNPDGKLPHLYFVKVDVQACFDTIEQTKLLEILRELISEDVYMTQRYGQIGMETGRIKRTYVKKAVPEGKYDHPHFLKYAAELAGVLRHTIFVDQVVYPYSQKREILNLLEEHITENIVKIGNDFYRQTVGIPQGSILSALLCCFFYGDLEKRYTNFKDDLQNVLLRLIDDYLFITTSHSRAKQFLDMMNKGHPEYGCFISKDKTLTNFDFDAEISNVTEPKQQTFPWCGYTISMEDLSVTVDYSRYNNTNLRDTLTVDRGRRPGAAFTYKMLWLARAKSHPIYSDPSLNTEHVVYLNIYQNFLLCAMKMHGYLRDWGIGAHKNAAFIHNTVHKMVTISYTSIRNKTSRKLHTKSNDTSFRIQKPAVTWLGTRAFHAVLNQKPQRYGSLLRSLGRELSRPHNKRFKRQFHSLVKEGQAGMSQIAF
ncbi:Telomerase reverse transcriptase [Hypsizygus marmoreus]|uniref:Telomerase reverse transcriptase n=1 Tax=Hypsizygus marmoreus TaxID=39966 RepID=A0A369K046_HYPMA|nr:Telomerase reverse transcriptase [Hypsizygus marmoreus]